MAHFYRSSQAPFAPRRASSTTNSRISRICLYGPPLIALLVLLRIPPSPASLPPAPPSPPSPVASLPPRTHAASDVWPAHHFFLHEKESAPELASRLRGGMTAATVKTQIGKPDLRQPISHGMAWFFYCRDGGLEVRFTAGCVRSTVGDPRRSGLKLIKMPPLV